MGCALKALGSGDNQRTQIEKRFLIIGLDGAGKTSILRRLTKKDSIDTEPTVGLSVEQIVHRNCVLTFWDLAGAATFLWKHYYHNTDAIVFVVDSTDLERIDMVKEELVNAVMDSDLTECPLLVYGNKQDKEGAMGLDELSAALEFDKVPCKHKFIALCSAATNEGIFEGLEKVAEVLIKITPGA
eukprot:TRINITY_DN13394_c0_g1_i3.p1 TRINITY_DN13394_c0_g1~~TRINITY_DN13394_c0_g1_i3.p1  ORF type:complete len:185 (-),score=37.22 TRINITY_DN13394_c0_g1_i3:54-608(-)